MTLDIYWRLHSALNELASPKNMTSSCHMQTHSALLALCNGKPPVTGGLGLVMGIFDAFFVVYINFTSFAVRSYSLPLKPY